MHPNNFRPFLAALLLVSASAGPRLTASVRAADTQAARKTLQAAAPSTPKIGDVTISGGPTMIGTQNVPKKTLDLDLRGPHLMITSARYDIAAPHIQLSLKASLVHTGIATGGVEIHIRNPEDKQHSSLTCTTANYFGATPSEPAHLHLIGPVHAMIYDPQLAEPLDTVAESCEVTFLPDGTNKIVLNNGGATVTPIEPAPKVKK